MTEQNQAPAPAKPIDPKVLAKKFRIDIEEAQAIVNQYGDDKKAAEKAARRVAA
ncbi:hypothetical protein OIU34_38575 [Pararhizobium sp. BT-229]|uniref:hypothetical protein n=1 Tax=Pararhizobium sp. BT-229 TaxID=2986923 RepID=UPI0021F73689|nr:hypothetical protein [Pararhizobium sp. BT-229]MCV9967729.1 hypothetical protein [Pararhizobium sp. BT-229]